MSVRWRAPVLILTLTVLAMTSATLCARSEFWDFPELPEPYLYGSITIDRQTNDEALQAKPVIFSHFSHRLRYTCRVCHFELEFEFKRNATEITEQDNRNGQFCGACHNNDIAFGHTQPYCDRCHTDDLTVYKEKFDRVWHKLPHTDFGSRIDWLRSYRITRPKYSIFREEKPFRFAKTLELKAEWSMVPPAFFPHAPHVMLLDCSNCHPDIFNIKKKTTKHFRMEKIIDNQFCGVCHLRVAFPMQDCQRCHPAMEKK